MDIIEELKYYCNEPQPVGAIMLTGEWGCGKTYLLKNELTEIMKDTHIFIHLSLFMIWIFWAIFCILCITRMQGDFTDNKE